MALLLIATSLGASSRVLTTERPLDAPVLRPNLFTAGARVATNGETTFACWLDGRSGRANDVFAKRLDRDGNPAGDEIPIVTGIGDNERPEIVWDGRRFLVVASIRNYGTWIKELRTDGTTSKYTFLFYQWDMTDSSVAAMPGGGAMILYRHGGVLEMRTIDTAGAGPPLVLDVGDRYAPDALRIVRSGSTLIAVWQKDSRVLAQRIDAQGVPGPFPLVLGKLTGGDFYSQLVIAGAPAANGALLAYSFAGKVNIFTISNGGAIAPLTTFTVDLSVDEIAAAPDGGFVAAEYQSEQGYWTTRALFHRFDRDGRFVESLDVPVGRPALFGTPGVVVILGWSPAFELVSRRYGEASATPVSFIAPPQTQPRFATDGTNVLMFWNEQGQSRMQQQAAVFDPQGQMLHPPVTLDESDWNEVEAGFDGDSFFLAFGRFGSIAARRITRDGALGMFDGIRSDDDVESLTAAGRTIAWSQRSHLTWLNVDGAGYPVDTKIETRWVVAGTDGASDLLGFVTPLGEIDVMIPGASPVPVANGWLHAIAGNGTNWLITYGESDGIFAELLAHDSSPQGKRFKISDAASSMSRVVWDGEAFIVIWWQNQKLYATTIDGDSSVSQLVASGDLLDFAAVNAGGSVLIAYQRRAPEAAFASRIFLRTLLRPRQRAISHQ